MGYFDRQSAALFKKDAQGGDVFFIWGNLGRGRVIPTETDGVAVADERLTYREAMAARGTVTLWFLAGLSTLLLASSLFLLIATDAAWIGVLCTLFSWTCLGVFVWMLVMRRRG